MLNKFVAELKDQREKAGITLQNVAAKTRIDIKFLEALEDGNFNFLPEIYVKAFIKQYAKVIGLDEEETLQKYILAKEGKQDEIEKANQEKLTEKLKDVDNYKTTAGVETTKPTKIFTDDDTKKGRVEDDKKKKKQIIIAGSIIVVVALLLLIFFVFINERDEIIVEEKPYEEVLKETPNRYIEEEKEKQIPEEKIEAKIEELTLTITNIDSTDSAWVLVIVDNKSVEDFLLLPKISKTIKANNNFYFTLGNSGVVKLVLNGKEIEFNGRRGVIRYFKLDANGLERVYAPPKLNND